MVKDEVSQQLRVSRPRQKLWEVIFREKKTFQFSFSFVFMIWLSLSVYQLTSTKRVFEKLFTNFETTRKTLRHPLQSSLLDQLDKKFEASHCKYLKKVFVSFTEGCSFFSNDWNFGKPYPCLEVLEKTQVKANLLFLNFCHNKRSVIAGASNLASQ